MLVNIVGSLFYFIISATYKKGIILIYFLIYFLNGETKAEGG